MERKKTSFEDEDLDYVGDCISERMDLQKGTKAL